MLANDLFPVFLNNNATSYPKPPEVLAAVQRFLETVPCDAQRGSGAGDIVQEGRRAVAAFFNADSPDSVVFTSGATESLNIVLRGLTAKRHIITTATEHNSVLRTLFHLQRDEGLRLSLAPCDARGWVNPDAIKHLITNETDAIVVNHCSNVTGIVQDLSAIATIAQQAGIPLIVDAAQSAGIIPIDLRVLPIAALVFTGHKNLLATTGIGGLVLNPNFPLRTLKTGGTGSRSDYLYQPEDRPTYFEAGTANTVGIAALVAALGYLQRVGMDAIRARKEQIYQRVWQALGQAEGLYWHGGTDLQDRLPVINWTMRGFSVADLGYILEESYRIRTRAGLHCAPLIHQAMGTAEQGTLRLSFSHLQSDSEIEHLIEAMQQIIQVALD